MIEKIGFGRMSSGKRPPAKKVRIVIKYAMETLKTIAEIIANTPSITSIFSMRSLEIP